MSRRRETEGRTFANSAKYDENGKKLASEEYVDSKASQVYRYKGSVATKALLPLTGNVVGDVYNVLDTGDNYAWDGTSWDKLAGLTYLAVSDITALTTEQINSLRAGDIVVKKTGDQRHSYRVSYKEENVGICLTYVDASISETVSYDYNGSAWVYNSTDVTELNSGTVKYEHNIVITNLLLTEISTAVSISFKFVNEVSSPYTNWHSEDGGPTGVAEALVALGYTDYSHRIGCSGATISYSSSVFNYRNFSSFYVLEGPGSHTIEAQTVKLGFYNGSMNKLGLADVYVAEDGIFMDNGYNLRDVVIAFRS